MARGMLVSSPSLGALARALVCLSVVRVFRCAHVHSFCSVIARRIPIYHRGGIFICAEPVKPERPVCCPFVALRAQRPIFPRRAELTRDWRRATERRKEKAGSPASEPRGRRKAPRAPSEHGAHELGLLCPFRTALCAEAQPNPAASAERPGSRGAPRSLEREQARVQGAPRALRGSSRAGHGARGAAARAPWRRGSARGRTLRRGGIRLSVAETLPRPQGAAHVATRAQSAETVPAPAQDARTTSNGAGTRAGGGAAHPFQTYLSEHVSGWRGRREGVGEPFSKRRKRNSWPATRSTLRQLHASWA